MQTLDLQYESLIMQPFHMWIMYDTLLRLIEVGRSTHEQQMRLRPALELLSKLKNHLVHSSEAMLLVYSHRIDRRLDHRLDQSL
jgi:hypothetical protein